MFIVYLSYVYHIFIVYLLCVVVLVRVGCTFGREMCWLYGGIGLVVNKCVKSLHNQKIIHTFAENKNLKHIAYDKMMHRVMQAL